MALQAEKFEFKKINGNNDEEEIHHLTSKIKILRKQSDRVFLIGVMLAILQLICVSFLIYRIFVDRKLAMYNPAMFTIRILMCICVIACLKNDLQMITTQDYFNEVVHAQKREGLSDWETAMRFIFLMMRFAVNLVRYWMTYICEIVLVGYIITCDEEVDQESSIDLVQNFTALLILVQIDEIVVGSFLKKMIPAGCLEEIELDGLRTKSSPYLEFEEFLQKDYVQEKCVNRHYAISEDDY